MLADVPSVLSEAAQIAHEAADAQAFLRAAGELLERTLGADAMLGVEQLRAGGWRANHVVRVPDEILRRLTSNWAAYRSELNPVFEQARTAGAAVDSQVLGAELARSTYFREIAAPQGAKATAIVLLSWRKQALGALILGRRSEFSPAERQVLRDLSPTLSLGMWANSAAIAKPPPVPCRDARAAQRLSVPLAESTPTPSDLPALTPRERDLVDYVRLGYTNKEVALACGISPNTVRNRLAALFARLGVSTRVELAMLSQSRCRDGEP